MLLKRRRKSIIAMKMSNMEKENKVEYVIRHTDGTYIKQ
jgi:tRNA U54 and U55 pseudouridine synthase Pus10